MNNHDEQAADSPNPAGSEGSAGSEGTSQAAGDGPRSEQTERLAYPNRDSFPYTQHPYPQHSSSSQASNQERHVAPQSGSGQSGFPQSGASRFQPRQSEPHGSTGQNFGAQTPHRQPPHSQPPQGPHGPHGQPLQGGQPPQGSGDQPWSNWEQAQATKPQKKQRKGPGWAALIAVGLIASLLGGVIGVGVVNARWANSRPAAAPTSFTSGNTDIVESDGTAPDWPTVASAVGNSVVAIDVSLESGASAGSGFVIDAEGHIITNDHVVSGANAVFVTLHDGRVYEAELVGADESTDLAVIKLVSPPDDLTIARLGDSSQVAVGDPVAAIGNPLGLSSTMTTGIVSALDRPVQTIKQGQDADATRVITNAIQIDAAVNPGNSGGPVFDENGQVIGVASSIASLGDEGQAGSIGLGFAIPSNLAQRVAGQLIEDGVAEHAFLGVSIVDGIGQAQGTNWTGAEVRVVEPGTPADMSGIQVGDVVIQVDGRDVSSALALTGFVRQFASGDVITLLIVRNGELVEVDVTLATRPD